MEGYFGEHNQIVKAYNAADLNGASTVRIKLSESYKIAFLISCANVAADLVVNMQQHDAASGGNSKALETAEPYFSGETQLDAKTERSVKSDAITISEVNGQEGIVSVEILAENLDIDNGFEYVSLNFSGGARTGSVLAIPCR